MKGRPSDTIVKLFNANITRLVFLWICWIPFFLPPSLGFLSTRGTFRLFKGKNWLNDEILNAYFKILRCVGQKLKLFESDLWVQHENLVFLAGCGLWNRPKLTLTRRFVSMTSTKPVLCARKLHKDCVLCHKAFILHWRTLWDHPTSLGDHRKPPMGHNIAPMCNIMQPLWHRIQPLWKIM